MTRALTGAVSGVLSGQFDDQGVAAGSLDPTWGPIRSLRLAVQAESDNWVILSEVSGEEIRQLVLT